MTAAPVASLVERSYCVKNPPAFSLECLLRWDAAAANGSPVTEYLVQTKNAFNYARQIAWTHDVAPADSEMLQVGARFHVVLQDERLEGWVCDCDNTVVRVLVDGEEGFRYVEKTNVVPVKMPPQSQVAMEILRDR